MKKILTLVLAAFLTLSACDDKKESNPSDKPTIKIGVSLPLSGEGADVGSVNKKAIGMALEESKNKETKYNYELIFENDMLQPKQAALIASKLINVDKVNAILSMWGIVAPVIADVAQKNKIINITCAGLSDISKPYYIFNNYTQDAEIIKTLAKKLQKENIKTIVFVTQNNFVGKARAAIIPQELKKAGIDVLATELYNPDEKDFRMSIAKLEKLNPDYYVMFIAMPGTKIFTEQLFQITGKKNLTAIDVFHEMPADLYPIVNGLWYVKSTNGTPEFAQKLKEKTNDTIQSCAGNSYENLNLLIWAYENTPLRNNEVVPNNEDVAKTLYGVKNRQGAIGEYSIDDNGIIQSKATLEMMVNGKPVAIGE